MCLFSASLKYDKDNSIENLVDQMWNQLGNIFPKCGHCTSYDPVYLRKQIIFSIHPNQNIGLDHRESTPEGPRLDTPACVAGVY